MKSMNPTPSGSHLRAALKQSALATAMACCLASQAQAADIPVPNGGFETLYKPGSTTITADTGGGWTQGVGPNAAMEGGLATYSDATTGSAVDIPGWINAPATGTPPDGGWVPPYGWPKGSGLVARQLGTPYGTYYYSSNGSNWGNPNGGAIQSAAPLTTFASEETYTISMYEGPGLTLYVLDLLADGVILTPDSSSSSPAGTWTLRSKRYGAASLASSVGKALTIRVGWGVGAAGARAQLDNVSLATSVPDTTLPTLTSFEHNKGSGPIVTNEPVTYTVTFSEPMYAMTVDVADFANTGATAMTVNSVTPTADPAVFSVVVTPTEAGTLQLKVAAGATLKDLEGNALDPGLVPPDDSTLVVTDDPVAPTLTSIDDNVGGGPIVGGQTVIYTVTFSEGMNASTVGIGDFDNAESPPAIINSVTPTGNPAVFTVTVTSAVGTGKLQLRIMADAVLTDIAGNALAVPLLDETIIDTTPPPAYRWQGTEGGNWTDVANWNNTVPGASDTAILSDSSSAGQTLNLDTDVTIAGLTFNNQVANQIMTSPDGKTLTLASNGKVTVEAGSLAISANVNSAGTVTSSGPGALTLSGTANSIGGAFFANGGSLTIPGSATLAVTGERFLVNNGCAMVVSGTLNLLQWSTVGAGEGFPGAPESTMIMKDSAKVNTPNSFFVVADGGVNDGRLTIQDSAELNASMLILGQYGQGAKGFVIQNNGTVNLTLSTPGGLWYPVPALQIGSAASINWGGTWGNGQGEYHLNGGTLTAHSIGGGGTDNGRSSKFFFNSGTLKPTVSDAAVATALAGGTGQTVFMQYLTQVVVEQNGAIIDTADGLSISIDQSLEPGTGNGGLTKQGLGTLTLLQASSYTGPTLVQGGTLACATAASVAPTALEIDAAAVVDLQYAGTQNIPSLKVGIDVKAPGVYGSSSSSAPAANQDDVHFAGTGTVTVGGTGGYTAWATTNGVTGGVHGDSNNDGVQNGIAYFMNNTGLITNPGITGDTVTWPNGGNIPVAGYGTQFVVQTSPDLVNWTDVPSGGNLSNTAGSVSYTLPTGAGKLFVRLVVTPTP